MMKGSLIGLTAGLLLAGVLGAQVVIPPSAKRMTPRPTGGGTPGGVSITTSDGDKDQKVRYTTHIVLADSRQWTSTDGRTLQAKMIAFEDLVVETPKDAAQPKPPALPPTVTVVRAGKIRLVSDQKPYELALERLSQADRDFVEKIRAAHAKKAETSAP